MNTIYVAAGDAQAGPIGLAIVVVLGVAIAFLGKSMTRHLSKLPESFEKKPAAPQADQASTAPTPSPGAADRPSDGSTPQ